MIRQNRKIQFIILLTLVCLVGTMTIAYAILSTTLNINGTAEVMDASWNVHFENINVNPNSVPISPTITDNDKITFSADLTTPGQFYKFTVDIVNSGSIDAMIETIITNPELTTEQKKYLRYEVEYIDGTSINETQLIKANETKTISVLVSYRNDIPTTDLPTTETNLDLEIRLVYVQATTISTEIQSGDNPIKVVSGDLNTVGSEICIDTECFYLINNDGYTATMLAKYNLYVGGVWDNTYTQYGDEATGFQDPSKKGYVVGQTKREGTLYFATSNYWIDYVTSYPTYIYNENSNLYSSIETYKTYLENSNIIIEQARTISVRELEKLGCSITNESCKNSHSWLYSSSYWTGDLHSDNYMWIISTSGSLIKNNFKSYGCGVRPVIEVPLTEF